jgi:hypothetical protein
MPTTTLFDGATTVDAAGLSLNLLCQHYPGDDLRKLIEGGTVFRCLFLAPYGKAIAAREHEEDYPQGHLSALTEMNVQILVQKVQQRLPEDLRDRLVIATYDETIRFNIMLINGQLAVVQPYLPAVRGVESPTFVLHRQRSGAGLLHTFEEVFTWLWDRSEPV